LERGEGRLVCCWEADFIGMQGIADKYRARLEAAGDSRELSRILAWLGESYLNAARFDEAEKVLDRALKIGEELEDEECIAYAMWDQMWLYMVTPDGRPLDVIETMTKRVLQAAERLKDPYLETLTYFLLSSEGLQRGQATLAAKWAAKLIELGRRRRYAPAQSLGWVYAAFAASLAEDHDKALGDSKLAVGTSHGHFESIMAESAQGVVLLGAGCPVEALSILQRLRREVIESSYLVQLTLIEIPCGVAMVQAGDYAGGVADLDVRAIPAAKRRARRHLEQAVRYSHDADTPGILAQALADLGLLCKSTGQLPAGRKFLEEARVIAEELGARKLIARIDAAL
jgi:tetratricopeptide (TPR) repeat protein